MLGGSLYIKYTHLRDLPFVPDNTSPQIRDIDHSLTPEAPDYFHEEVSSPGKLQVSFSPVKKSDTNFRLEFFDRYLEWDRVRENNGADSSDTPRTVIDLSVATMADRSSSVEVSPVTHALTRVD